MDVKECEMEQRRAGGDKLELKEGEGEKLDKTKKDQYIAGVKGNKKTTEGNWNV